MIDLVFCYKKMQYELTKRYRHRCLSKAVYTLLLLHLARAPD